MGGENGTGVIEPAGGLVIEKYFSASGDPYTSGVMDYSERDAVIKDDSGKVVENLKGVVFPKFWSNNAVNTVTSKYFRKEGVPSSGRETDIRQLAGRVAKTISRWGERQGYFDSVNGKNLEEELAAATIFQHGAFNSPVWFNLGLDSYGIKQDGEGYYMEDGKVKKVGNFYEHPQVSACFISSPDDSIESMIYTGAVVSARVFKGGSGIGGSWHNVRSAGEPVSGGGVASGAKRFMDLQDSCARVIKSGGKTRRAATFQGIPVWHPDMPDVLRDKYAEEQKARILIKAGSPDNWESHTIQNLRGQNVNISVRTDDAFWQAYESDSKYQITAVKTKEVLKEESARKLAKFMAFCAHGCGDPGIQNHNTVNKWNTCKNSGEIWASNPCVTGDTKVLLKDGGWTRIDSILGTETVILTNTGTIQESKISGSFKTGIKPVYQLTTKSGFEIKLTADHKVFTINRGFVDACDLTKDDYVLIPSYAVADINEVKDQEFFQILGVYLGDGGSGKISSTRGITLSMSNKSEIKILEKFSDYIATNYERITHKNSPASVRITKTSAKYVITNSILMSRIAQMVDLNLQSHEKCISDKMFKLSLSEQGLILQGLFTSDGTVANYGLKSQYIALDSTSIQLLKDVQILLLGFGIKSKIYQNRRAGKNSALLPDGKGGLKEYEVREMHSLRISRDSRIKFEKLIGFLPESPKFEKLKILNESVEAYQDLPIDAVDSLVYLGEEQVYDLTEPLTHTFVANGITVHNCSEYMFLNNSACNLASLNLMRFRKTEGDFDLESFCKAVDLFITSQDILVSQASYPEQEITEMSDKFRPLGLGFANLGAYIMSLGIPYDSDEARDLGAALASLMTAEAYLQSTRLAEKIGAFKEYEKNKEPMLEVMQMHKKAAKQIAARNSLEGLVSKIKETAIKKWDEGIERGKMYGYRNAQVTLLAPTGTIGFMMDCDTTGCEPDMALKKYKELAGGGGMTIVNQTVPIALEKLGYNAKSIEEIVKYIDEKGMVEGCKELNEEHLPVFDCSMQSSGGTRVIHPMGHIRMLGALQPHLSGAISKTVNCPESTTVEEIEEMFYQSWKLGVKAVAIYRDGSKASQPVRTKKSGLTKKLERGEREHMPSFRFGMSQKVKIGSEGGVIPLFLRTGEYDNGRLGELFIDSLERGSEVNRLLNEVAIEFSEKIQYGVPLEEAIEIFNKAGKSQISGLTDHPFIKVARGPEGFIYDWLKAHYLGDISFLRNKPEMENPEMRPLPWELRVYQQVPQLHLIPEVDGEKMYPGAPSLEDTIKKISGTNFWKDEGLDTRQTIDEIRRKRIWKSDQTIDMSVSGRMTGRTCDKCGNLMVSDGSCWKCPSCKKSTGGCGGG